MCREALNSVTAEQNNQLMNHVDNDVMEQLHQQLSDERTRHQRIVSQLQQQLANANTVGLRHCCNLNVIIFHKNCVYKRFLFI